MTKKKPSTTEIPADERQPHIGVAQGSFEWFKLRYARVTMSEGITTLLEGGVIAKNNLLRTIRDRRTHNDDQIRAAFGEANRLSSSVPAFVNGHEQELKAIAYYEMTRGLVVDRPGFVIHPLYPWMGASTDFIEYENNRIGAGEIKCPINSENHLKLVAYKVIPTQYFNQLQGNIECVNADYGKFLSYDARQTVESNVLVVVNVERSPNWTTRFHIAALEFGALLGGGGFYEPKAGKFVDGLPSMF